MTNPNHGEDLVVLVTPTTIATITANSRIRPLGRLPVRVLERAATPDELLRRLVGRYIELLRPRRVILSVRLGTPHDAVAIPVFDALSERCDESGTPLLWVPDLVGLVAALTPGEEPN